MSDALKQAYKDFYAKLKVENPAAYKEMRAEDSQMITANHREIPHDPQESEAIFHEGLHKRDGEVYLVPIAKDITSYQREVLSTLQDMTLGETAEKLKVTKSAVYRVVKRIKKRASMIK